MNVFKKRYKLRTTSLYHPSSQRREATRFVTRSTFSSTPNQKQRVESLRVCLRNSFVTSLKGWRVKRYDARFNVHTIGGCLICGKAKKGCERN